ncbi:major facilitator superfamily domain-containing protein [Achaetomium macrosporum]|uniref:Major facilitator superfamily domain-containing protein n=1 Tax=Achaetomium macrosporum TaxID=79813 RepID=A0AAN7C0J0_9PEZI|nr:major facilitator superfamily domain-containing protein [Achaetomium macrosporum]
MGHSPDSKTPQTQTSPHALSIMSIGAIDRDGNLEALAPHTIFNVWEKRFIVFVASAAAFFSPISANIYFPALNTLSSEYGVSTTLINLTVTVYMIFQGLAPSFTGSLSDTLGRRPVYFVCFVIYIAANIGLALQHSFVALVILRCVQSSGSSGTVALANAVVSDVATAAERGMYIGYASLGGVLGIALGPIIGGLLSDYLGWRAIFWFLVISAGTAFLILGLFLPETARSIVDNGSIRPPRWDLSLWDPFLGAKRRTNCVKRAEGLIGPRKAVINPFTTLKICVEKEASIVLLANGIAFAGYYAVASALPSQFAKVYNFDDLRIGLSFIPIGVGSGLATMVVGRAVDWNFARHSRLLGLTPEQAKKKNHELGDFPIERVRCEIALPILVFASVCSITYGWVLDYETNVAGPLVLLFFVGFSANGFFTILSILMVDIYSHAPATATAANNLVRCWIGAGTSVAIIPMVDRMTSGWAYTFIAFLYLLLLPLLWIIMRWGPKWRGARVQREKQKVEHSSSR